MTTEYDKSDENVTSVPFSLVQYLRIHWGRGMQRQIVFFCVIQCAIPFAISNFVTEMKGLFKIKYQSVWPTLNGHYFFKVFIFYPK